MTEKQIKRNVLRFMGFDLPDEMLDDAHDIRVEDGKFKLKTKASINTKDWRITTGTCA